MCKLLIVDDEAGFRKQLSLSLTSRGYDVVTAESGERAIALGCRERPDVVVCDWMLGDHIHGLNVLEVLRAVRPQTQCVLMTGYASKTLQGRAEDLGIAGFLSKPFEIDELAHYVEMACRRPIAEQAAIPLAILEADSSGEILYRTEEAKRLLSRSGFVEEPVRIQDLFSAENAPRLETAGRRWIELPPRGGEDSFWLIRSRELPGSTKRLYLILSEEDRPVKIHSLVNMLLGLPGPSPVKLSWEGHILVFDTSESSRLLTQEMMERIETVCHAASNATEAMELCRRDERVSCVIVDSSSPRDVEGFVRQIRVEKPEVILIGTSRDRSAKRRFASIGVENFVLKPYVTYDMVSCLTDCKAKSGGARIDGLHAEK